MSLIVQPQASHCPHIFPVERGQENTDVGDLIGNLMPAKDIASHYPGLFRLPDIGNALGKNSISIIGATIPGQEANKTLERISCAQYSRNISTNSMSWHFNDLGWVPATYRKGGHFKTPTMLKLSAGTL